MAMGWGGIETENDATKNIERTGDEVFKCRLGWVVWLECEILLG